MLQSYRNSQTLKILGRLRKQGAPSSNGAPLMGTEQEQDPEEEALAGAQEQDLEGTDSGPEQEPDPSGQLNAGMLGSMNQAKKKLKRRY